MYANFTRPIPFSGASTVLQLGNTGLTKYDKITVSNESYNSLRIDSTSDSLDTETAPGSFIDESHAFGFVTNRNFRTLYWDGKQVASIDQSGTQNYSSDMVLTVGGDGGS